MLVNVGYARDESTCRHLMTDMSAKNNYFTVEPAYEELELIEFFE